MCPRKGEIVQIVCEFPLKKNLTSDLMIDLKMVDARYEMIRLFVIIETISKILKFGNQNNNYLKNVKRKLHLFKKFK